MYRHRNKITKTSDSKLTLLINSGTGTELIDFEVNDKSEMREKLKKAEFELESVKLAGSLILQIHFATSNKSKTSFDFVFNNDQAAHVSSGCMILKNSSRCTKYEESSDLSLEELQRYSGLGMDETENTSVENFWNNDGMKLSDRVKTFWNNRHIEMDLFQYSDYFV